MFSYQIALWKTAILNEMALPHESPWLSEWYGTSRANLLKLKLGVVKGNKVIPYLAEGALHKGKWVKPMIEFLNNTSYNVDYSKRGLFLLMPNTYLLRIRGRIKTFVPRILSNLDLLNRRIIKTQKCSKL